MLGARGWTIIEAVCEKEVLSRVPVIRPEGPGCSRLRALTLSAPVAGTIYLSSDHVRNGRERSYSGRFRFLHFLVVIDTLDRRHQDVAQKGGGGLRRERRQDARHPVRTRRVTRGDLPHLADSL